LPRQRKKASLAVVLLVLGFLAGFATATVLRPAPQGRLLPEAGYPDNTGAQRVLDEPGYGGQELIFHGYLGIYSERIAIFQGVPPDGTLQYLTDYEIRDDVRDALEDGVPFSNTRELLRLLENFTS
jgi:hypothetical protein